MPWAWPMTAWPTLYPSGVSKAMTAPKPTPRILWSCPNDASRWMLFNLANSACALSSFFFARICAIQRFFTRLCRFLAMVFQRWSDLAISGAGGSGSAGAGGSGSAAGGPKRRRRGTGAGGAGAGGSGAGGGPKRRRRLSLAPPPAPGVGERPCSKSNTSKMRPFGRAQHRSSVRTSPLPGERCPRLRSCTTAR